MTDIKQRTVYVLTPMNKADDDDTDVYVGSTSMSLKQRLAGHRYNVKRSDSKLYRRMGEVGVNNWEIVPLFQRTCDKETILGLERKWVKIMGADLNSNLPVLTSDERETYHANYYKGNKQSKRYHCDVCDLSFISNRNLQRHLKTSRHFWTKTDKNVRLQIIP